jgi:UDP-N-acetyl-2-amino-2-deoxyglucuronate dehydrogenase
MKINIAIIGCGRIADHHCKSLLKTKKFNLLGVCDIDEVKAKNLAQKYKTNYFINYDEMLVALKKIDIISLMTPSGMHYYHAKDIINKYKKNLVIEKPTFMQTVHAKEVYKLAQLNGTKIFPVYQNRFNKAVKFVKKIICKKNLGKIRLISLKVHWCRTQKYYDQSNWRGTFSMDGGATTNQGIHFIDLMRYFGGEIQSLQSLMKTLNVKIEVEDTSIATLVFKNGALGNLEISTAARNKDYEASITIIFEKGYLKVGGIAANEIIFFSVKNYNIKKYNENFDENVYGNGHVEFYKNVHTSFIKNKPFVISQEDCIKTISLLNALYKSADLKKKIFLRKDINYSKLGIHSNFFLKKYFHI